WVQWPHSKNTNTPRRAPFGARNTLLFRTGARRFVLRYARLAGSSLGRPLGGIRRPPSRGGSLVTSMARILTLNHLPHNRPFDELRQRDIAQKIMDFLAELRPQLTGKVTLGVGNTCLLVDRLEDLGDVDFIGRTRQSIAAPRTADALYQPPLA